MVCILEDNENALLSKLFRCGYDDTSNIIYAEGNANIKSKVIEYLDKNEYVICLMDLVPGVKEIANIFKDLGRVSKKYGFKLIVIPIVCSEYYLLKSIRSDLMDLETYIRNIQSVKDNSKSYEYYCKQFIRNNVRDCISLSSNNNQKYGFYYEKEFCCDEQHSLIDKSLALLREYPCVPNHSKLSDKTALNYDDLWNLHREYVNHYNSLTNYCLHKGCSPDKFRLIKPYL